MPSVGTMRYGCLEFFLEFLAVASSDVLLTGQKEEKSPSLVLSTTSLGCPWQNSAGACVFREPRKEKGWVPVRTPAEVQCPGG